MVIFIFYAVYRFYFFYSRHIGYIKRKIINSIFTKELGPSSFAKELEKKAYLKTLKSTQISVTGKYLSALYRYQLTTPSS